MASLAVQFLFLKESDMDTEQLREYCIQKPDVEEGFPFGPTALVFKVNGKMFLLASLESQPLQFNLKCDPEKAIELREQYPCVMPGYHMNKKLWNTVVIDGTLSSQQLREFVDHSYDLVSKGKKK
jgi:predicted DNA-binding protein (MmcQ/YjbR family)